jgi:molecular chaperone GrpE
MTAAPHSIDDEAIATEAVDSATLLTENRTLREENRTLQDRLLRALAEAENVRRQAERAAAEARQYSISEFARELLIVVDNLQRTLEATQPRSSTGIENATLVEGVQATLRIFLRTLERFGIRQIDAQGKLFDPNFHEAVMHVDDPSQPPGTVTQVVEQGYTIHGRLLRPARVVVSKRPEKKEADISAELEDNELGMLWDAPPVDQ